MIKNPMNQYKRTQNATSSQLLQVAILLEHCGKLLQQMSAAIDNKNIEERFIHSDKTTVILSSLMESLAIKESKDALELHKFFQNMITGIVEANIKNDKKMCETIRDLILQMAHLWRDADRWLAQESQNTPTLTTINTPSLSSGNQGITC